MAPDLGRPRPPELPDWFPAWAAQLVHLYFSGTTAAFVLHGNTSDLVRNGGGEQPRYGVLAEFLAEQLFPRRALVLHYDLGRGLRGVRRTRRAAAPGQAWWHSPTASSAI